MKKIILLFMIFALLLTGVGCSDVPKETELKYVFLFIGDGMSFNTVQLARDAIAARESQKEPSELSFTDFDSIGVVTNYDATSFIPDSASSGTAIATGIKTDSGYIAKTSSGSDVESIATTLKKELGMKIGIITTANLNHATPSVFYAHSSSRYDYTSMAAYIAESDFDFFAGGEFLVSDTEFDLEGALEASGYVISDTYDKIKNIDKSDKNIIISPDCDYTGMMSFNIDRDSEALGLAQYLDIAINTLDGEDGFFIMCEGGRIDSALHANDAATAVGEVEELSEAVEIALDFYKEHPDETLIIVTGDHETGGLSLGYTATEYNTYFEKLSDSKMSYLAYDERYAQHYKQEQTPFEQVLGELDELFGLGELNEYEYAYLKRAYEKTLSGDTDSIEDTVSYYGRTPLTVEVARTVNHRAGIGFSSFVHTAAPMGLWAKGVGEDSFSGAYDNTDIYNKMYALFFK